MNGATLCSGIGAPEQAMPWVDWKWCAEIEAFPSAVLAHHRLNVPNLGDITAPDFIDRAAALGPLDLIVAGTPCQAFSVAGLRKSLADARGNLTLRFVEILDVLNPNVVLWENVPGCLNTRDNAFGCFLGALVGADSPIEPVPYSNGSRWWKTSRKPKRWRLRWDGRWDVVRWTERYWPVWPRSGMAIGPKRIAAWVVKDAQYFGLAQRRERVFVVACPRDGADPSEVLLIEEGVSWNSPPRREAGEDAAGTLSARTQGGGGLGTDFECQGGLVPEISMCLNAGGMKRIDGESETFIAHALRAEGFDASEDGTGRGTPIVPVPILEAGARTGKSTDDVRAGCGIGEPGDPMYTLQSSKQHAVAFSCKDHGADAGDIAPTLRSMGHDGSHANGGGQVAVAFNLRGREDGVQAEVSDVASIRAASGGSSRSYAASIHENQRHELTLNDTAGTLKCNGGKPGQGYPAALHGMAVRRLTPTECERLQGFPDGHTAIMFRGKEAADGPRYKALGNSMAVPVIRWIGDRIQRVSCAN